MDDIRRMLPVAPRPFADEALGSWIGRLAGRYRIAVEQLDRDYELGLSRTGPLGWLQPGPLSEHTHARLEWLARISRDTISSLLVETTKDTTPHALYCGKCVFLNPLEVESPYWKREWLAPEAFMCRVHRVRLKALPASKARYSVNMPKLILQVGKYELKLRESH
jgi:hypothetical protein